MFYIPLVTSFLWYSLANVHLSVLEDNTPSPNSYTLPALLGPKVPTRASVPAYSMAGRSHTGSFSEDLAKSPGPGRYNIVAPDVYSKRSPAYSMLRRNYMPESMFISVALAS